MIKAVLDTNLFVSALIGGQVKPVLEAWKARKFELVVSEELLAELLDVLHRPKFNRFFSEADVRALGGLILERAEFVIPKRHFLLSRDPKDNFLLDIAYASKAQFLVTGDRDFLDDDVLKTTMLGHGVEVVTVAEFLQAIDQA